MHPLALRIALPASLVTLALAACGGAATSGPTGEDRVTISRGDDLSSHVVPKHEPVEVHAIGAANALAVARETSYALTLVAEVAPPELEGDVLQATSVTFHGDMAVVSYNTAGEVQRGAIDVIMIDTDATGLPVPRLASRAVFADTDVSAVSSLDGRLYLATATGDPSFGTPAVLEALTIEGGELSLGGHVRVPLSSYVATSVTSAGGRVFATSGNTGGVHAFDPATGAIVGHVDLADARWVASPGDGTIVVVQGTPGRVAILAAADLAPLAEHPFEGAQIPESKSTVEVLGGKAFIAGGPGGTIVMDLASGAVIATIPVPLGLPLAPSEIVTNAVSVDGALVFISNGAAGVFMVEASDALDKAFDPDVPPSFRPVGRLAIPGEIASVNHIAYRDGLLFVAGGRAGLEIVRVDDTTPPAPAPTGYPYTSSFDDAGARAGWITSGSWGFGAPDGARVGRSGTFLDNNPTGSDQYDLHGQNQTALLDVPLVIPAEGAPVIAFDYGADFIHPDDKVELQIQNAATGAWSTRATFDLTHERSDLTRRTVDLDDYRGQTIKVRFKQKHGKAAGARRFVVDDLAIADLALPTLSWPLATSFESALDRSAWNLEGSWGFASGDAFDGELALDANPAGTILDGWDAGQIATLQGFVPVPASGRPVFGFWYRSDLVHDGDKVDVDIQIAGEAAWSRLVRFTSKRDHDGWTYRELSLANYAGKSVRVRLVVAFAKGGSAPRHFAVDALGFGELAGPALGFPYACDFDSACASDWVTEGMLDLHLGDGGTTVAADPIMLGDSEDGHEIRMLGFVAVPSAGDAVLSFRASLGLIAAGDKVQVDLQDLSTGQWLTLRTYKMEHSRPWTRYEIPLDGFADRSVRLRFRTTYGDGLGQRQVAIDDVRVEGQPALRHTFPHAPALDATGVADWSLTGTWRLVGGAVDANPDGRDMASFGAGHEMVMGGFVQLPAAGRPTLFVALDLGLVDPGEKVMLELQVAGEPSWRRLRTYQARHNRDDFGWDEIALGEYAGLAVRVRMRFELASAPGPRRIALGGLRFEDLVVPVGAYPWSSGFTSDDDASAWTLWGAWAAEGGRLDGNPDAVSQRKWDELQTATLGHAIAIPATGPAWLGFRHHFGAIHKDDKLKVEVQTADGASWATLATLGSQHVRDGLASLELPLDAYRGKSVRIRFAMTIGATDAVHAIAVDDVWVGERALPPIPAPYDHDFAGPSDDADWALHGSWGYAGGAMRSNPTARDTAGFQSLHTATLEARVDLSGLTNAVLDLTHTLALVQDSDRAYVEIIPPGQTTWTAIASLKKADNVATPTTRRYSLTAYAGSSVRVRMRVSSASGSGARDFAIRHIYVGAP